MKSVIRASSRILKPFQLVLFILLVLFTLLCNLSLQRQVIHSLRTKKFRRSFFASRRTNITITRRFPVSRRRRLINPVNSVLHILFHRSRHRKANLPSTFGRVRSFLLTFQVRHHDQFIGSRRIKFHHRYHHSNRALRLPAQRTNQRTLTMTNRTSRVRRSISLLISSIQYSTTIFREGNSLVLGTHARRLHFKVLLRMTSAFKRHQCKVATNIRTISFRRSNRNTIHRVQSSSDRDRTRNKFTNTNQSSSTRRQT